MTYSELSTFGTLRKMYKLGPVSMFYRLLDDWKLISTPSEVTLNLNTN